MKIKNVGFIGLGAMGSVMAPLIVSAGYHVFGYDIHSKIDKSSDINQVYNIRDLSNLDVIIFMLPDGKIVADVTDELLQNNIKSILIDMSSSCLLYTSDAADDSLRCRSRWSPYH